MKIVVDKKVLEEFIQQIVDDANWPTPSGGRTHPAVVTEPPMRPDPVVISPATEDQVHEPNMPVDDPEWYPGNVKELSKAASQLVGQVPEGQREWFWGRLRNLVSKALGNTEGQPGAGDMEYEAETLPTDKQRQRSHETWAERQQLTSDK